MTIYKPNRLARAAVILTACCIAVSAEAADKELLDILLSNGAINQEQYDRLLEKPEIEKADVDEVVTTINSGGFRVKSADGDYAIKIGTRLHAEISSHKGDLPAGVEPVNGSELRRARIETSGTFHGNYDWAAEIDFADNLTTVKDFRIGYTTEGGSQFSFGSQKQPYSLSLEMSSNDIPFVERSIDNFLLAPFVDRAVGFRFDTYGKRWFAAAGVFGDAVNPNNVDSDEGWGLSGRFIYAPILGDDQVLHLGVRAAARAPSRSIKTVRVRDETTHISNLRIVDTGVIDDVDRADITGFEAAYAKGPFSVIGEYSALKTQRGVERDLDFDSWSVYGTWAFTGESKASAYRISSGEFKRLTPDKEFSPQNGTWGAWELALRYATINLNDGDFVGGSEDAVTTALNWYLNNNLRLILDWTRIVGTDGSTVLREAAEGLNIYQFRTQYTF